MKKVIAFLLTFVIVALAFTGSVFTSATAPMFTDVQEDYAFAAIQRWAEYGVIRGRGGGIFDPYGTTTRAEFATMITNIMGYVDEAPIDTFTDIPNNQGMNGSILRATAAGVFPPGGAFRPNDFITRAEATVALVNALELAHSEWDETPTHFVDDAILTPENRGAIRAAVDADVIRGFPYGQNQFRFGPNDTILRKHLAIMFDNAFPVWQPHFDSLEWRDAVEGEDYEVDIETFGVLTFILVEMLDSGWGEHRFLINGHPAGFTRVFSYASGMYQYRYVVDWVVEEIDDEPVLTVQIR